MTAKMSTYCVYCFANKGGHRVSWPIANVIPMPSPWSSKGELFEVTGLRVCWNRYLHADHSPASFACNLPFHASGRGGRGHTCIQHPRFTWCMSILTAWLGVGNEWRRHSFLITAFRCPKRLHGARSKEQVIWMSTSFLLNHDGSTSFIDSKRKYALLRIVLKYSKKIIIFNRSLGKAVEGDLSLRKDKPQIFVCAPGQVIWPFLPIHSLSMPEVAFLKAILGCEMGSKAVFSKGSFFSFGLLFSSVLFSV